jgi:triacylglycerol esterase/lipase EstA (alpha/beta hydrolase family)
MTRVRSLSPQRRHFAMGVGILLIAVIVAFVVRSLVAGGSPPPADQGRPGPVILVPGYGGDVASLADIATRLRAAGRRAQILPLPDGGTGDLQPQADALQALVARDLEAGAPSVDLVGYSAGGVAVRLWASQHHQAAEARRIVTIGSPQHGTSVASAASLLLGGGCTGGCAQLEPGSTILDRLNEGDETPNGPLWTSVWSTADQTVVPPSSAHLIGADNVTVQSVCPADRVSHSQEPRDPAVIGLVLTALGTGRLPRAGTGNCARFERLGALD